MGIIAISMVVIFLGYKIYDMYMTDKAEKALRDEHAKHVWAKLKSKRKGKYVHHKNSKFTGYHRNTPIHRSLL